jgi:aspartate carbamoyltransferase regulatory subunit
MYISPSLARLKSIAIKHVRGCSNKKRFIDQQEAENVLKRHSKQRVYHCEYCKGWHLTSEAADV